MEVLLCLSYLDKDTNIWPKCDKIMNSSGPSTAPPERWEDLPAVGCCSSLSFLLIDSPSGAFWGSQGRTGGGWAEPPLQEKDDPSQLRLLEETASARTCRRGRGSLTCARGASQSGSTLGNDYKFIVHLTDIVTRLWKRSDWHEKASVCV